MIRGQVNRYLNNSKNNSIYYDLLKKEKGKEKADRIWLRRNKPLIELTEIWKKKRIEI